MQQYHPTYSIILEVTSHDELEAYLRKHYRKYALMKTERGYLAFITEDLENPIACLFEFGYLGNILA